MDKLKLTSFVLLVEDVLASKAFYQTLLDQEVALDIGDINVGFKSGLALWQKQYAQNLIFEENIPAPNKNKNELEVCFETSNIDEMWERAEENGAKILHPIKTQPWQQRVFRLYDPDGFIVEVAEALTETVKRLSQSGMSIEVISEKTFLPKEVVESMLQVQVA